MEYFVIGFIILAIALIIIFKQIKRQLKGDGCSSSACSNCSGCSMKNKCEKEDDCG